MSQTRRGEEEMTLAEALAQSPKFRSRGKGKSRRTPGVMNRLEESYSRHLDLRKSAGEIEEWWFEALSFRVGNHCKWHPDFMVMLADGTIELHDCKGFTQDDARVKARAIADKFPFDVYHVTRKKGEWKFEKM